MNNKKKAPALGSKTGGNLQIVLSKGNTAQLPAPSTERQRSILLDYLKTHGSFTTLFSRETLGIMSPAPRIKELREQGHKIITERIAATDCTGTKHYGIARYVLAASKEAA